ncbi:MAG: hypothetical protein IJ631_00920 [Schwartzia sp.]|nr:hypothetical protein [Schwartzia sp. (in: firmicutes)]
MWKKIRNKKIALGLALLAASMAFAPTMTNAASTSATQSERPAPPEWNGNGEPPAPPTDENGNPLPPPGHDGNNTNNNRPAPPNGQSGNGNNENRPAPPDWDGNGQPPAPPTDENGNPLPPPDHDGNHTNNNRPLPPHGNGGNGQPPQGMQGGPSGHGQDAKSADSLSASHISDGKEETVAGKSFAATKGNESAVLARNGAKLSLSGAALQKRGDTTSEEESNFAGQNAVLLANNSTVAVSDTTLSSNAEGANAIFSTGRKAQVTARRVTIRTGGNSSRGLDATYGGTVTGEAVDIATKGAHCAALATDRGEGTVSVTGSKLVTEGEGSPCIYSTGDISATDTVGVAYGSEIAVVEGKNSIALDRVDLTGHERNGVMLYQSFSGDADVGTAKFSAKDSKLTNESGGAMFYVTNTKAEITLEATALSSPGAQPLLRAAADRWGQSGKNGGDVTLTATRQTLNGDITADNLSAVTLNLGEGSQWTGTMNTEATAKAATIRLAKSATWTLSADAHLDTIINEAEDFSNIESNGFSIYYNKDKTPTLNGNTYPLPGGGTLTPQA